MKPNDWNELGKEERRQFANALLRSKRGQFIISQALTIAIKEMNLVGPLYKEVSSIQDMEILRDELFPIFYLTEKTRRFEK